VKESWNMAKPKLKLKPVAELPTRHRTSEYTRLVQEFLKGKDAHAELENAPKNGATSLRNAVKNLGVGDEVEVKTIGGVVYLTKK
jgi:hypothetical protein